MGRYSRHRRKPSGFTGGETRRLTSLIILMMVLFALCRYTSDPSTWAWVERETSGRVQAADLNAPPAAPKARPKLEWEATQGEGPDEMAPGEREGLKEQLQAVSDLTPLGPAEMPAYWRFMRWAHAEKMPDLERRALPSVVFTQLYEDPDRYRGKLIRLRLHVRRILDYEAPENTAGIKRVYELWAWTDDSRSYPYVVVVPEIPPWFKLGAEVSEEAVFVGYFLKTMSYIAFEKKRAAPLLVGRLVPVTGRPRPAAVTKTEWNWILGVAGLAVGVIGYLVWRGGKPRRSVPSPDVTEQTEQGFADWVADSPAGPGTDGPTSELERGMHFGMTWGERPAAADPAPGKSVPGESVPHQGGFDRGDAIS